MKIYFITTNRHKVEEVKKVLGEFNIEVEQLSEEKYEPKEMSLQEVTEYNAKQFYKKIKKPVIVEDTGIFFDAYPNFPGNHPKLIHKLIGYKGLLKLLEGENRNAHFKSVLSFYEGKELKTFEGRLQGEITKEVHDLDADVLPYERIFNHEGKMISSITREEKNKISHRAKACRKFGEWFISR